MAAKRDRNPPHPARAAAWGALGRTADLARRYAAVVVVYATDRQFAARTGCDRMWDRRGIGDIVRRPRSLGD